MFLNIRKKSYRIHHNKEVELLTSNIKDALGDNPSVKDIVEYLKFDDPDFILEKYENEKSSTFLLRCVSIVQRILSLIIVPLIIVFVFPFQWLITGKTGFTKQTKFGKILLSMIGQ